MKPEALKDSSQYGDVLNLLKTQFLNWSATRGDIVKSVEEDHFQIDGKRINKFMVKINYKGIEAAGHGRALSRIDASSKSLGEAIERYAMLQTGELSSLQTRPIIFENGSYTIGEKIEDIPRPTNNLYSSNGWAVHYSKEKAIESAALEALERHILMKIFIKHGWKGFSATSAGTINGIELYSLLGNLNEAGFGAGIGLSMSNEFPGICLGYACDKYSNLKKSSRWEQAFYETFDCMRIYRNRKNMGLNPCFDSSALNRMMDYWLMAERPKLSKKQAPAIKGSNKLNARIYVKKISDDLNMDFSFYAAYVFGEDLIPLYTYEDLEKNDINALEDVFINHDLDIPIAKVHPVL